MVCYKLLSQGSSCENVFFLLRVAALRELHNSAQCRRVQRHGNASGFYFASASCCLSLSRICLPRTIRGRIPSKEREENTCGQKYERLLKSQSAAAKSLASVQNYFHCWTEGVFPFQMLQKNFLKHTPILGKVTEAVEYFHMGAFVFYMAFGVSCP